MISPPPNNDDFTQPVFNRILPATPWAQWFSDVFKIIASLQGSGTTADRPTKFLWIGRPYFDTTLGYEIHYNGTIWVKWDGTAA